MHWLFNPTSIPPMPNQITLKQLFSPLTCLRQIAHGFPWGARVDRLRWHILSRLRFLDVLCSSSSCDLRVDEQPHSTLFIHWTRIPILLWLRDWRSRWFGGCS